jgi:hypothetical protein
MGEFLGTEVIVVLIMIVVFACLQALLGWDYYREKALREQQRRDRNRGRVRLKGKSYYDSGDGRDG